MGIQFSVLSPDQPGIWHLPFSSGEGMINDQRTWDRARYRDKHPKINMHVTNIPTPNINNHVIDWS